MSVRFMDEKFYSQYGKNWDDDLFREQILDTLNGDSLVLDLGAGAGIVEQMNFRGVAQKVCGVDLDDRVLENPYLDEAKLATAERLPYENDTFDVVFSDNVLEHLDNPNSVFAEVSRVLKPGGRFLVKTPNKFHYVAVIATITPHRLHRYINKRRGRKEADTFPTRYKANSKGTLMSLAEKSGLEMMRLLRVEGRPEYLRMNVFTYALGLLYERLVNSVDLFAGIRVLLIADFRKRARQADAGIVTGSTASGI